MIYNVNICISGRKLSDRRITSPMLVGRLTCRWYSGEISVLCFSAWCRTCIINHALKPILCVAHALPYGCRGISIAYRSLACLLGGSKWDGVLEDVRRLNLGTYIMTPCRALAPVFTGVNWHTAVSLRTTIINRLLSYSSALHRIASEDRPLRVGHHDTRALWCDTILWNPQV